jgi:hypothetical protein
MFSSSARVWTIAAEESAVSCLNVTTEQLEREFVRVFGDGRAVPEKCWIDHFHDYGSFLRAVYSQEFGNLAATRLLGLRSTLQALYGADSCVAIVVLLNDATWKDIAAHRLWIHCQ